MPYNNVSSIPDLYLSYLAELCCIVYEPFKNLLPNWQQGNFNNVESILGGRFQVLAACAPEIDSSIPELIDRNIPTIKVTACSSHYAGLFVKDEKQQQYIFVHRGSGLRVSDWTTNIHTAFNSTMNSTYKTAKNFVNVCMCFFNLSSEQILHVGHSLGGDIAYNIAISSANDFFKSLYVTFCSPQLTPARSRNGLNYLLTDPMSIFKSRMNRLTITNLLQIYSSIDYIANFSPVQFHTLIASLIIKNKKILTKPIKNIEELVTSIIDIVIDESDCITLKKEELQQKIADLFSSMLKLYIKNNDDVHTHGIGLEMDQYFIDAITNIAIMLKAKQLFDTLTLLLPSSHGLKLLSYAAAETAIIGYGVFKGHPINQYAALLKSNKQPERKIFSQKESFDLGSAPYVLFAAGASVAGAAALVASAPVTGPAALLVGAGTSVASSLGITSTAGVAAVTASVGTAVASGARVLPLYTANQLVNLNTTQKTINGKSYKGIYFKGRPSLNN